MPEWREGARREMSACGGTNPRRRGVPHLPGSRGHQLGEGQGEEELHSVVGVVADGECGGLADGHPAYSPLPLLDTLDHVDAPNTPQSMSSIPAPPLALLCRGVAIMGGMRCAV